MKIMGATLLYKLALALIVATNVEQTSSTRIRLNKSLGFYRLLIRDLLSYRMILFNVNGFKLITCAQRSVIF